MTIDRVLRAYRARPFIPFTIHFAGERSIRVPHPDFFAQPPDQRTVAVFDDNGDVHIIDLLLVSDLHVELGRVQ